ncbi:MAG: glutathione S-transferase family protein [Alphaproteobacteria bacterium]
MELYHNDMSVCSQKVRLVLHEKGLKPKEHYLNLRLSESMTPAYLKLNPNGVVPTLVDRGRPIIESTVINEYLEDAYPERPLRPADPIQRAEMRLWTKIPDEGLHAACATISSAIAFRHQYLVLSKEEFERNLRDMPDATRRERRRQTVELGIDAPFVPGAVKFYDDIVAKMHEVLKGGNDWLVGDAYSLADVSMLPYIVRLEHLALAEMWTKSRPAVGKWLERCRARANYTAIQNYINPKYIPLMAEKGAEALPKVRKILAG